MFQIEEHPLATCSLQPFPADLAMAAARQLAGLDPWLTLGYTWEKLAYYLEHPDACLHTYLITVSGQAAGLLCCRHPWLFGPFLELLAIYPRFQGRGFGREVLTWLESQSSFRNIWTTVSAFNLRALNFYTKFGFTAVGPLTDLVGAGFDEILLRKKIRPPKPRDVSSPEI